jgi:hypothetical protein
MSKIRKFETRLVEQIVASTCIRGFTGSMSATESDKYRPQNRRTPPNPSPVTTMLARLNGDRLEQIEIKVHPHLL